MVKVESGTVTVRFELGDAVSVDVKLVEPPSSAIAMLSPYCDCAAARAMARSWACAMACARSASGI